MKICSHCYSVYTDDEAIVEGYIYDETPYGRAAIGSDNYVRDCEACGGDLVEAKRCRICGEWIPEDTEDICDSCLEDATNLDNVLAYAEEITEPVELNGFLAELGAERINEILTAVLRSGAVDYGKMLERYVAPVSCEFAEFVASRAVSRA